MTDLFTPPKDFRRGETIYSKDFNETNLAVTASFRKLGSERTDGPYGVQNVFGVDTPYEPQHAATKGYVDTAIENVNKIPGPKGDTGPTGAPGTNGTDGTNLEISGTVASASDLDGVTDAQNGDVFIALDTSVCYVLENGVWEDIGAFGGEDGATGPQGPQGPAGQQGATGSNGSSITGPIGPQGPQGVAGQNGRNGANGADYSGPVVSAGTQGQTLFWSSGQWVANSAILIGPYGIQVGYLSKPRDSIIIVSTSGYLSSAEINPYGVLADIDFHVESMKAEIKSLKTRLSAVENKE